MNSREMDQQGDATNTSDDLLDQTALDDAATAGNESDPGDSVTEVLRPEDLARARAERDTLPLAAPEISEPATSAPVTATAPHEPGSPSKAPSSDPAVPSRGFILLASYASAVTLALILVLFQQGQRTGDPAQLESLPDIPPEQIDSLTFVPADVALPPGHRLELGESQRFGNLLVEPLRITRGPVVFEHYSGDAARLREDSEPVWKLHLRVTNVSEDQEIPPFDRHLTLRWVAVPNSSQEAFNNYITKRDADSGDVQRVSLFRLPASSEWNIQGEHLGKILKPGESYETFLASEPVGLEELPEDVVWRVQIRKGFGPSGNGVTTVFEVAFNKSDVQSAGST